MRYRGRLVKAGAVCLVAGVVMGYAVNQAQAEPRTTDHPAMSAAATAPAAANVAGAAVVAAPGPGAFQPRTPRRVLNARTTAGTVHTFTVADLPVSATAVTVTVTAMRATNPGILTVFPGGEPNPGTYTLSYPATNPATTTTTVKLGASKQLSIATTSGSTDIVVDLQGYFVRPLFAPQGYMATASVTSQGQLESSYVSTGDEAITVKAYLNGQNSIALYSIDIPSHGVLSTNVQLANSDNWAGSNCVVDLHWLGTDAKDHLRVNCVRPTNFWVQASG